MEVGCHFQTLMEESNLKVTPEISHLLKEIKIIFVSPQPVRSEHNVLICHNCVSEHTSSILALVNYTLYHS